MMAMIFSWNTVWWALLVLYVPACLGLTIIVLLQKGKGVGFAGAFGAGGGSDAVFGPRSSKSLPQRITYSMAALYMLIALLMSMLSGRLGNNAAPSLVDDTGMSATSVAAEGSLGALFNDGSPSTVAPVTPAPEAAVSVETPVEESAPAEDAAPDAAPEAAVTPDATTPAPEAAAPAAAPEAAPVEEAAPAEAPAAEAPATDAPAAEAPAAQ